MPGCAATHLGAQLLEPLGPARAQREVVAAGGELALGFGIGHLRFGHGSLRRLPRNRRLGADRTARDRVRAVRRGGDRLLFDCGEGAQRQMQRSTGLVQVDEIYLTHFHADHYLGIPGLLKTYDLTDRERPLRVYGPPGLIDLFRSLERIFGRTRYRVDLSSSRRARRSSTTATRSAPSRSSTA